jgi:hypothetical protein
VAGHQANLYGGSINASQAIQHYIDGGVDPDKIVVGIPVSPLSRDAQLLDDDMRLL